MFIYPQLHNTQEHCVLSCAPNKITDSNLKCSGPVLPDAKNRKRGIKCHGSEDRDRKIE